MRRAALLGFLILAVLATELPDVHNHAAETPGFYNEECPLARLAVSGWGLPALTRETPARPELLGDPSVTPTLVEPIHPARSAFAPRAPPATS
jgi:hypothetical protein